MDDPDVCYIVIIAICLLGLLLPADTHLLILLMLIGFGARAYLAVRLQVYDFEDGMRGEEISSG